MNRRNLFRAASLLAAAMLVPACKEGSDGAPGPSASSGITFDNSTSGMAATTVQDAIDELDQRLDVLEQVPSDSVHLELSGGPLNYTVPAGSALVVTFLRAGSSSPITLGGVMAGYQPVSPCKVVLNAGETVQAPNSGGPTPRLHGYLIPTAKAPGTGVHITGAPYTVPAGRTLYITYAAAVSVAGATNITVDGKLVFEAGTLPQGEAIYLPVTAGKQVSAAFSAGVHGYLK